MKEHGKNALYLAKHLEKHPEVERVYYPGLENNNGYGIAKGQMKGFGGMVSFEIKGGFEDAQKFISKLKIFTLGESLGGVESLVSCPSKMTQSSIPLKERERLGIKDNLIRLSIGIENKKDLLEDLLQTLE